ncbi:MAG TPA: glycosyltransferase [Gemmatimonadaceae bacterium]|jgi:cellulose synthase/poly-beta-1,6-N-acetylglucosamine synthase-like glycosyltransferase
MTLATILVDSVMTIMIFFLVINSFHAVLLMCSVPELWSHWQLADDEYFHDLVGSEALPPISVLATLHPGQTDAVDFARMLLDLKYPRFEVILVVDGKSGTALADLAAALELYEVPPAFTINLKTQPVRAYYRSSAHPRLLCLDKQTGRVGDALNAAVNAARYPHALSAAPNVVFEPDALLRLSRPFLLDRAVACVGGVLRPSNDTVIEGDHRAVGTMRGWTIGCQTIEYLRSFMFQRLGWNRIASNIVYPGNTVLFKREHVFGIGGFDPDEETPGIDLAVRLHKYLTDSGVNAEMPVIPDSVAWSALPKDMATIGRARQRWLRGLSRALRRNAEMFGNPEYGTFGAIAVPYLWLGIIVAPVLELLGYIALAVGLVTGLFSYSFAWAYLASVVGYGILLSVWTVVFQAISFQRNDRAGDITRLLAFAVIESLGYRQILACYRATAYFVDRQPKNSHGQSSLTGAA